MNDEQFCELWAGLWPAHVLAPGAYVLAWRPVVTKATRDSILAFLRQWAWEHTEPPTLADFRAGVLTELQRSGKGQRTEPVYACEDCSARIVGAHRFDAHREKTGHMPAADPAQPIPCRHCGESFPFEQLWRHVIEAHHPTEPATAPEGERP